MKFILSVLLITTASAIPIDNEKYEFHYVQHQSAVDNARQRMSQRLSEIDGRGSQRLQGGYASTYCASCPNGYSSAQSSRSSSASQLSSSSANIVEGSDYHGVGYVGHASDDLQTRVAPSSSAYVGSGSQSRFSSANTAYEEEDLQQRVVPGSIHDAQSSAYRGSVNNNDNIGYHDLSVSNDGKYESYSRRQQQEESETSRTITKPQIVYVPAPITSTTSQRASEASNQQRINLQVRPGTTTVLRVPVNVVQPERTQAYNARTGTSYQASGTETRPTYTVYYVPSNSYNDRYVPTAQPEKYRTPELSSYNSYNSQSRSNNEDVQESESYQTRVNPSTITDGGSSRYAMNSAANSLINSQQSRVVPSHVESSSQTSARTAEETNSQRRYTPARPNYVQRTYANNEESRGESSRTESTAASSQSRLSQQQQADYAARTGNTFSPYSPYATNSRLQGQGVAQLGSDNLYEYMSESERLARLQQQQIASSRQSQSSSSLSSVSEANRRTLENAQRLDSVAANFVGSSTNLNSRNSEFDGESVGGSGAGGFQRTKQWAKQSKWESGSQYGTDGTPKSFSMLSTAESEKHNINGAETGYKAATTTLENDGKVSTYSIHTP